MNSYIDYNYYSDTFGGTLIPSKDFDKYSNNASQEVRLRILNRDITGYETEVKNCTCKVAELLFNQDIIKSEYKNVLTGDKQIITSEKVGDYSRNISNLSFNDLKNLVSDSTTNKEITELVDKELLFTNLTYRGI